VIYVIQKDNYEADVVYAGSSAHEALVAASRLKACRVNLFKQGRKLAIAVEKKPESTVQEP
jgi:hypothetical protein